MTKARNAQPRNELARETSPYLLQHADNPVHWLPWGDRAFALAREQDKPVLLSIGYSACHWCHVMAHESFEDEATAALLNEHFVCVKVDREERPDVDDLYMTVCQLMTGSGGWPLTLALTPDRKAFFATTFVPRESRGGRLGMKELLPRLGEAWRTQRQAVLDAAERTTAAVADLAAASSSGDAGTTSSLPGDEVSAQAARELESRFDAEHGGFGDAPKFPSPHVLLFLLREHARTGNPALLDMVLRTLRGMRRGGVYDQLGYGLHRYSTDERWLLPHFEKMLYDQALLTLAALEAFQASGEEEFAALAREVISYVRRDLTSPEGTFHTAEDADSEGEEGRFYVWARAQLDDILGPEDGALAARVFGVEPGGNFQDEATRRSTGTNILHLPLPLADLARRENMPLPVLASRMESIRTRLLATRQERVRPGLDSKVLTDMNGLMLAALARGARVLNDPDLLRAAETAAAALLRSRLRESGLLHCLRGDDAEPVPGLLDDYAFLAWGLLELHEASLNSLWLEHARSLAGIIRERFEDREQGGFWLTPVDHRELPVRRKDAYDGATPSGNSVAAWVLLRLSVLSGEPHLRESGIGVLRAYAGQLRQHPSGFAFLLCALSDALRPPLRVALPRNADARAGFENALRTRYLPGMVLTVADDQNSSDAAQVCRDTTCLAPVRTPGDLLRVLSDRHPPRD
ncbi:thioredoxin domain-containing protein [Paucidesulfovibrio longus]|uniref:thioredoxin domain-containing protein n=1 Tax=Paucidesulfovibrio longus TaxID=889 RepID=UPI0003B4E630|nr:thioredoxin domain-containing protein [Paucidesulfovibrio longus]